MKLDLRRVFSIHFAQCLLFMETHRVGKSIVSEHFALHDMTPISRPQFASFPPLSPLRALPKLRLTIPLLTSQKASNFPINLLPHNNSFVSALALKMWESLHSSPTASAAITFPRCSWKQPQNNLWRVKSNYRQCRDVWTGCSLSKRGCYKSAMDDCATFPVWH